ncbi:MAG: alpha-L-arabinofuranosidase C-terminal domain-containing protein [Tepidisphaeraceae bacterium]
MRTRWFAQYLSAFVRRADLVKIACIAQIVNVIAPVMTKPDGLVLQTIYYPFLLFSKYIVPGSRARALAIESPTYKAGPRGEVPALDVSATFDPATGNLAIFCVNRSDAELTTTIELSDRVVTSVLEAAQLAGDDLKAGNTFAEPNRITPTPGNAALKGHAVSLTLPPTSFAAFHLATKGR